ncbi:MAG: bis(5'-nucleosyl)-tetraphosphatase (symmetrical) YqeK [Candidatus Sericytochromatia bacterium]|nr:bis(5'-nucleosyl)-tetraphosphatase (symmetrical) YqeK [Candidatus Sericytochromatia bacterium]
MTEAAVPSSEAPHAWAERLVALRPVVEAWLDANLSPGRAAHCRRVGWTARRLAERFGTDPDRAELGGLLHDVAREQSGAQLLAATRLAGRPVGYLEELAPMPCLHGPVGADVVREAFGVADAVLLSAIARHTVGGEQMTLDEQVLFLADAIEPGRGDAPWLTDLRAAAEHDLALACRRAYDHTFDFLLRHGLPIHPDAARGRNWFLHQERTRARNVVPEPAPEAPRLG